MSTQWLPNMNRILAAARTYKRACGKVRTAKRKMDAVGGNSWSVEYGLWWKAKKEREDAAHRLLWFVDTGEKSLAKRKP
jgi:hypothetical protein